MALKLSTLAPSGAVSPNAYWRITEIRLDTVSSRIHLKIAGYHNLEAHLKGRPPVLVREAIVDGSAFVSYATAAAKAGKTRYEDLATASYEHLKTLPEYSGAEDV